MVKKATALFLCAIVAITMSLYLPAPNVMGASDEAYKLDLSLFSDGDLVTGGIGNLGRSGSPDITVTEEDGETTIRISNRKDNWDALDLQNLSEFLKRDNTYKITVTGHIDDDVETEGANIKLGGVTKKSGESDGYPELAKVPAESGESFTIEYSLTIGQLIADSARELVCLRVQTDESSASNPGDLITFCIDDIVIVQTAEAAPGNRVDKRTKSADTDVDVDDVVVLYELDTDDALKEGGELSPVLKKSGDSDINIIKGSDGTPAIEVDNRVNNYDGVDITIEALKQGDIFLSGKYTFEITGYVLEGEKTNDAQFVLGMTESPWAELSSRVTPDKDGNFTITYAQEYSAADPVLLGYNFRIQSIPGNTTNFVIDNIRVTVEGSLEVDATELYSYTFDDEDAESDLFSTAASVSIEWADGRNIGHDDTTALKVTHIAGTSYTGADNAVMLYLPEPLPAGGIYNISVWFFIPAEENADKDDLTGPGIVLNGNYAGDTGVSKFPSVPGTIPVGEWKELNVTLPLSQQPIERIDFRYVVNDEPKHPDLWYIDSIGISRIGELENIEAPEWDLTLASLHETYSDMFLFGNVLEPNQVESEETTEMFLHHYNIVTAENAMKPISISKSKGVYNFEGTDKLIEWAEANDIGVHGHTLVWHSQSSPWLTQNEDGSPLTRAEAKVNLESYINTVAGHFKGKVVSWDVVNEAFDDGKQSDDWREVLRVESSPWYMAYANGADEKKGEDASDYIYDAFVLTRLIDPNAVLYFNDYNENLDGKREAIAAMTEELNEKWEKDPRNTEPDRFLIEGIGMQSHHFVGNLDVSSVEKAIQRFAETGVEISVTELDIPFDTYTTYKERTAVPTEEEYMEQAELYRQLFEIYSEYSDNIVRVSIWGKADPQSWRFEGYPVLFDKMFNPKASFDAIIEAAENK